MNHFKRVVFDEGDQAPLKLANAMQVRLGDREIVELTGMDFPRPNEAEEFVNWKPWIREAKTIAIDTLESLRPTLRKDTPPKVVRYYQKLKYLHKRLVILNSARPENWVVEEAKHGYTFDPIRPGAYCEGMLFLGIPNIVITSGTLKPKTLYMLGQPQLSFTFKEYDSDFNPARSPIYYKPTMRVDSRAKDFRMLWVLHDTYAAARRDRKGITHTVSFARRDEILTYSRFVESMYINEKGDPPTALVDEFRAAGPGSILVSPSVGTGYDFPGSDCEFQFVCKIPFIPGKSKIIKARQEDDKDYATYLAALKLEQDFGRGTRSKEDSCEGLIGDEHLDWFMRKAGHFFSRGFHRRFRKVDVLPRPLPKL